MHPTYPPEINSHFLYAATVFSLLTTAIMGYEMLWRTIWAAIEQPRPLRHPVTVYRILIGGLIVSMLMRLTCNVIITMGWSELSSSTIETLNKIDMWGDQLSWIPMLVSWTMYVLGGAMIGFQLMRMPVPINMWPSQAKVSRALRMIGLTMLISLAIAFLR